MAGNELSNDPKQEKTSLEDILGTGHQKNVFVNEILGKLHGASVMVRVIAAARYAQYTDSIQESGRLYDIVAVYEDGVALKYENRSSMAKHHYLYRDGWPFFYELKKH